MTLSENLLQKLKPLIGPDTLIVGIGSTLKGDDGVGPFICSRLKRIVCDQVIDAATVPENYIQPIIRKNPQVLLIIDAVDFGDTPGAILILEPDQIHTVSPSTHTPSPRLFLDVILHSIKPQVVFIGIQPAQANFGQPLSPPVQRSATLLADLIAAFMA
jgi:hydrogenase 3 maturation protease